MTRKVNSSLISQRNIEQERMITFAKAIESLEAEGNSPEGLKSDVKSILGLDSVDLLAEKAEKRLKEIYKTNEAFRSLVNFKESALQLGLLKDNQLETLRDLENTFAEKVAKQYDVEIEDLYEEEEK
jgi:hypothetical protein